MQIGFLTPSISTGINLILSKEPNEINKLQVFWVTKTLDLIRIQFDRRVEVTSCVSESKHRGRTLGRGTRRSATLSSCQSRRCAMFQLVSTCSRCRRSAYMQSASLGDRDDWERLLCWVWLWWLWKGARAQVLVRYSLKLDQIRFVPPSFSADHEGAANADALRKSDFMFLRYGNRTDSWKLREYAN